MDGAHPVSVVAAYGTRCREESRRCMQRDVCAARCARRRRMQQCVGVLRHGRSTSRWLSIERSCMRAERICVSRVLRERRHVVAMTVDGGRAGGSESSVLHTPTIGLRGSRSYA
uniref:Propionyl acylase n=1 Tax=Streptomyces mycarofaciens TaxID=1949 RepID=Q53419_STRMY|nr:propionyl acylase [Streptomyces mycarofaciens]